MKSESEVKQTKSSRIEGADDWGKSDSRFLSFLITQVFEIEVLQAYAKITTSPSVTRNPEGKRGG